MLFGFFSPHKRPYSNNFSFEKKLRAEYPFVFKSGYFLDFSHHAPRVEVVQKNSRGLSLGYFFTYINLFLRTGAELSRSILASRRPCRQNSASWNPYGYPDRLFRQTSSRIAVLSSNCTQRLYIRLRSLVRGD
jgi:hypothetical protein